MGDEEERRAQLRQRKACKEGLSICLLCAGARSAPIRLSLVTTATFIPSMVGTNHCTAAASKTYQPYFLPLRNCNFSSPVAAAT